MPGRTVEITFACPGRTPKSPSEPGTTTSYTSPVKMRFSGATNSN